MKIHTDWQQYLEKEMQNNYFKKIVSKLEQEYDQKNIYPQYSNIFNALNITPLSNTKVVILGQDPYHGENQANGLSFSVQKNQSIPPSLRNIFRELMNDLSCPQPPNGDLSPWAEQGVLLLNTVLTVEDGRPNSHKSFGWETFTDYIISTINEVQSNVVFILWGKHAQNKGKIINEAKHYIIQAPHPSPLSAHRGFFGSKPFSKANEYLLSKNKKPIQWCLKI